MLKFNWSFKSLYMFVIDSQLNVFVAVSSLNVYTFIKYL